MFYNDLLFFEFRASEGITVTYSVITANCAAPDHRVRAPTRSLYLPNNYNTSPFVISPAMSSTPSMSRSQTPLSKPRTSAPSSPPEEFEPEEFPEFNTKFATEEEKKIFEEEEKARIANSKAEDRRRKAIARKRAEHNESKGEREAKARQLDELLSKSAAFGEVLVGKTRVLGRVGSGMDGKALGEHDLTMAEQPKCMVGGTMREYQLEGLTWMYEICIQGMSGILADEMGLGKTIQTISLIALLREKESYLGPHLIIAPLSTLSNWIEEFQKWTPDVPVLLYHGTPAQRKELLRTQMMKHIKGGRPDEKFPVVCTSPEIVLRDHADLSKISWEFIIIVSLIFERRFPMADIRYRMKVTE